MANNPSFTDDIDQPSDGLPKIGDDFYVNIHSDDVSQFHDWQADSNCSLSGGMTKIINVAIDEEMPLETIPDAQDYHGEAAGGSGGDDDNDDIDSEEALSVDRDYSSVSSLTVDLFPRYNGYCTGISSFLDKNKHGQSPDDHKTPLPLEVVYESPKSSPRNSPARSSTRRTGIDIDNGPPFPLFEAEKAVSFGATESTTKSSSRVTISSPEREVMDAIQSQEYLDDLVGFPYPPSQSPRTHSRSHPEMEDDKSYFTSGSSYFTVNFLSFVRHQYSATSRKGRIVLCSLLLVLFAIVIATVVTGVILGSANSNGSKLQDDSTIGKVEVSLSNQDIDPYSNDDRGFNVQNFSENPTPSPINDTDGGNEVEKEGLPGDSPEGVSTNNNLFFDADGSESVVSPLTTPSTTSSNVGSTKTSVTNTSTTTSSIATSDIEKLTNHSIFDSEINATGALSTSSVTSSTERTTTSSSTAASTTSISSTTSITSASTLRPTTRQPTVKPTTLNPTFNPSNSPSLNPTTKPSDPPSTSPSNEATSPGVVVLAPDADTWVIKNRPDKDYATDNFLFAKHQRKAVVYMRFSVPIDMTVTSASLHLCSVLREDLDGSIRQRELKKETSKNKNKEKDKKTNPPTRKPTSKPTAPPPTTRPTTSPTRASPTVEIEVLPNAGNWLSINWDNAPLPDDQSFRVASFEMHEQEEDIMCYDVDVTSAFSPPIIAAERLGRRLVTFRIFTESLRSILFTSKERKEDDGNTPSLTLHTE